MNFLDFLGGLISKGPVLGGLISIGGIYGWKTFSSIFKPVSYVDKLYSVADSIVENVDNRVIDVIRSKQVKRSIQKDLKTILLLRKGKIEKLIERISD